MARMVRVVVCVVLVLGVLGVVAVRAQEEMSPDMEAIMKAGTPGEAHAHMARSAGNWKMTVTSWMAPGAPPTTSEATSTREMIMDGRYLVEVVKGDFGGMPFEGRSMLAFDNVDQSYYTTWIDNFSTGMMMQKGTCDAKHEHCEFQGRFNDPVTGETKKVRSTLNFPDADHETSSMYYAGPDGTDFKCMEIVSERVK